MSDPDSANVVDVPPADLAALHHRWLVEEPSRAWRDDDGTLVFFDISGFTPLTERLAVHGKIGAEELTDVLGTVFGELLGAAEQYGGDTLKFGGDAVLLHFEGPGHEARACAAAWEMQRAMRRSRRLKTSVGSVSLGASCGIASGPVHAFLAGSEFRELLVAGPTTSAALTMESAAHAGEILVAPSTARALDGGLLGSASAGGGRPLLSAPAADPVPVRRPEQMPTTPAVQPQLAPYLHHTGDGEHRQAVVAFLQYRGVDEILEHDGPAALQSALEALIGIVQESCAKHGVTFLGTDCDKGAGKIMLAAGAPAAGEHDEDQMLLCLREVLRRPQPLEIRAGVNRGRVFTLHLGAPQRRAWTTMGETTNLAARVMGKSDPGTLLATRAVMERTVSPFEQQWREPFMVKGVASAVEAAVIGEVVEPNANAQRARTMGGPLPFVGRDLLLTELEQLVREARGAVVELRGEAGIGKSRLLEELTHRAVAMGRRVLFVEGRPYGTDSAYGAVRPPLRLLIAGDHPTDDQVALALRERLPEPARRWTPLVGIPFGLDLPPTPEQLALTPAAARMRLRVELLPVLAGIVPEGALLIVEDGHWLDEASASLLATTVAAPGGRPLTTIVATREPVPHFDRGGIRTIELGPLDPAEVEAALQADDGEHEPLPPAVMAILAERSHGHPLLLEELLVAAREGRDIETLPDSIEALLAAHVDRVPPADRSVLRKASVLGMGFADDVLAELADLPIDEVVATLERLDDFIERDEGEGRWMFRQSLAREAAYEALPFRVRRALHGRAADLLEASAGDDVGPAAPILSLHAHAAGDHAQSWRFSRMAAERAERQGAPLEAAVFLRRALHAGEHMDDLTERSIGEVAQRLGDTYELAGLYEQAGEAYQRARRHFAGDRIGTAELCRRQGWLRERTDSYSQALRWYARGLTVLGDAGGMTATRLRGRLRLAYGAARLRQGRLAAALEPLLEAASLAYRTDDQGSLAHASYLLDWANTDLGHPEDAERYRVQALRIYEELGDWTGQANVLNNLGVDAFFAGDWQGAMKLYERSRKARERGGDVVRYGEALVNIGELLVDQGRLEEARPRLRRALGLWRGAGFPVGVGVALMNLGRAAARLGDDQQAEEFLERARETLEAIGSEQTVDVAIREGERQTLRGRGREALAVLDAARAEAVRRGGAPVLLAQIDRLRAAASAQEGDLQAARRQIAAALDAAQGTPYEVALATDLQARIAPLVGDPIDHEALAAAHAELRRLGVQRIWPPPLPGAPHDDTGVPIADGAEAEPDEAAPDEAAAAGDPSIGEQASGGAERTERSE